MTTYFCHNCAIINGTLRPIDPQKLTDNRYKLQKYFKHTVPTSAADYRTLFTSPTSITYADLIVSTTSAGNVQIDSSNRVSVTWVASSQTGYELKGGALAGPTDGVKIVLLQDLGRIHAFPIVSTALSLHACAACGKSIPV